MSSVAIPQLTRRRRRAEETPWQRAYFLLVALAVAAAVAVPQGMRFASWLFGGSGVGDPALGSALLLGLFAGFLLLLSWVGPIVVSPADARWLIMSPVGRRGVLARSATVLLAVLLVAGVLLGLLGSAVLGRPDLVVPGVLAATALVLAAGSAAVLVQAAEPGADLMRRAVVAVAVLAGGLAVFRPALPSVPLLPVPAAVLLLAAVLGWRAWQRLATFPARALVETSVRVGAVVSASVSLEPALLTGIAELRYWRRRRLRSRPWPAAGPLLMTRADLRMAARRPGRLVMLAALAALPALIRQAGGSPGLAVLVLVAGGLAAAVTGAAGARWDAQHPELPRLFAGPRLGAHAIVPGVLAALWAGGAFAFLHAAGFVPLWSVLFSVAAAPALAAAGLRMARRGPINHAMPVIDLGFGGVPTGPIFWAAAGVDLAFAGVVPLLFLPPGPVALGLQAALGVLLLAGYLLVASRGRRAW
ncbi:DUF6297 family protein [Nonomuraea sp. NPDC004297]